MYAKSNGESIQKLQAQDPGFPFYIIIIYINIFILKLYRGHASKKW